MLACSPGPRADRIVLVTIDTLRADHVGAYGREPSPTPTLDALAAAGTRFTAAFSPAPLTLPSHATLLTGRDPHEHGARHNGVFPLPNDVPTLTEALQARGFGTAAFVGAYVLDRSFGLARGFDTYDDQMAAPTGGASQIAERRADLVVDEALAWLKEAPDQFFLWVHLYDPHAEYRPPARYRSKFDTPYDGEIAFADAQIARLRTRVDGRWPDGKTLWTVTSDHGESLGEHGEATHAYGLYDATQQVPLILAGPGFPAGGVVDSVVGLRDIAPTLGALAGARSLRGASGRSLMPLLAGDASEEPGAVAYLETVAPQIDWRWSPLLGIRTATHKYIRAPRPELYDVRADPGETRDLSGAEPDRVAELDAILEARVQAGRDAVPSHALSPEARARLEALGYVARRPDVNETLIGRVGGIDPKDELELVTTLQRANQLLGKQRATEALAALEGLGSRGVEVAALRTVAALGAGRIDIAHTSAREAAALAPGSELGWVWLGRIAELEGDLEQANVHYTHANELETGAGTPQTGLGRVAEMRGDLQAAEAHYRAATEARLPDLEARWRLGALLFERGEHAASQAQLAAVPKELLDRPEAASRLIWADQNAGRPEAAQRRLLRALLGRPESLTLLSTQGR
ncbi:MAG: sulfatase-like hydrolase/transferase, partial [Myxococcales bacterium]|nr:sulfatase-like hydrolase/transferase [Myxococcales bacterium]